MTAVEERRIKVLLQESLEDMAVLKAVQQDEKTRLTSRGKIFQRLARAA